MKTGYSLAKTAFLILLPSALLVSSCKKSSSSSATGASSSNSDAASLSESSAASDNAFDDAFNVAVQTNQDHSLNNIILHAGGTQTNGMGGSTGLGAFYCASVSVTPLDTVNYPKQIVVDFGSGCTSLDGITRSGSITYNLSKRFRNPGATISATFTNYVVNGYKLGGTYTITNNSSLTNGIQYTTAVTGGSVTNPNDSSYTFSGTKTVTQTAGIGSLDFSTYVFSVTGNYMLANSWGQSLTANITTPLVKQESCKHIVSGVVSFVYTKGTTTLNGTFDYGSGACDSLATIKIGTYTKSVTLP